MRSAASHAVAIAVVILILISVPPPAHPLGDHARSASSADPSTSSPASFLNPLAIPSSISFAQGSERLAHPRSGLIPISMTSPQVSSSIPAANYDEQLGTTFTQSFTSIAYNVSA